MIAGRHHLTDPNLGPTLYVNGSQLKPVSCTEHLGVEIDSRVSPGRITFDKICKKVSSGQLKTARPFVTLNTLDVQCHFDYCGPVWYTVGKTLSEKLQRPQNRAARVITAQSYDTRSEALGQQLRWEVM